MTLGQILTVLFPDISDGLLVAMVLMGLPPHFKSFVAVVTQADKNWSFKDLKASLVNGNSHQSTITVCM